MKRSTYRGTRASRQTAVRMSFRDRGGGLGGHVEALLHRRETIDVGPDEEEDRDNDWDDKEGVVNRLFLRAW